MEKLTIKQLNVLILLLITVEQDDNKKIRDDIIKSFGDAKRINKQNKGVVITALRKIFHNLYGKEWVQKFNDFMIHLPQSKAKKEWNDIIYHRLKSEKPIKKRLTRKHDKIKKQSPDLYPCKLDPNKNCVKDYKRNDLVSIAKSCDIAIAKGGGKQGMKTKKELCDAMDQKNQEALKNVDWSPKSSRGTDPSSDSDTDFSPIISSNESSRASSPEVEVVVGAPPGMVREECKVYRNCEKAYLKNELVAMAIDCGVDLKNKMRKTKTKKELCNDLFERYGHKDAPVAPKKKKTKKKSIKKKYGYPQVEMDLEPKDRVCTNEMDQMMEEVKEIPTDKFVKTSYGYCHNIDDLIGYLIATSNKNEEPLDLSRMIKIWANDAELATLISHSGLDSDIAAGYNDMLLRLEEEKKLQIKELTDQPEVLKSIGKAGFLCLNDKVNEFAHDAKFKFAETALLNLREQLESKANKQAWLNLKGPKVNSTVEGVLQSVANSCIHGVGFKLSYIFCYWSNKFKKEFGKRIDLPLFMPVPNTKYYIGFHASTDKEDIDKLPPYDEIENKLKLTIVYYNVSDTLDGGDYGRIYKIGYDSVVPYGWGLGIPEIKNFLIDNNKHIFKEFSKALYDIVAKVKAEIDSREKENSTPTQ